MLNAYGLRRRQLPDEAVSFIATHLQTRKVVFTTKAQSLSNQ